MRLPPARVTFGLIGATALVWAVTAYAGLTEMAALWAGFVPATWMGASVPGALPGWITPLSATLVHATFLHVAFNLLMLGFCGRYVEAAVGAKGLLAIYLIGAYAAAAAQFAPDPGGVAPMVGASGAGSAVLGAYAILYGQRRPLSRNPRLARLLHAGQLAFAWLLLQLLVGYASSGEGNSIAIAAHVGGFIAGLALAYPLLRLRYRKA